MYLEKFFNSETGKHMLSIILGLGLASLFRSVCKGKNCLVFKSPPMSEIQNNIYKFDKKCYKYNPVPMSCKASNKKIIDLENM